MDSHNASHYLSSNIEEAVRGAGTAVKAKAVAALTLTLAVLNPLRPQ